MKYAVAIMELLLLLVLMVVPALLAKQGNSIRLLANEITKSSEKLNKFHQNEYSRPIAIPVVLQNLKTENVN